MANKLLKSLNFGGADTYTVAHEWKHLGESETGGDTLTWYGNSDGKFVIDVGDGITTLTKISDVVLTPEDCANGLEIWGTAQADNSVIPLKILSGEEAQEFFYDGCGIFESIILVPHDNFESEGFVFPKKGIYAIKIDDAVEGIYTSSLTINGYTGFPMVKPIDTKYLPKALQFGVSETVLIDNQTMEVIDGETAIAESGILKVGTTYKVVLNGVEYNDLMCSAFSIGDGSISYIGNPAMLGLEDTGVPFIIFNDGEDRTVMISLDETATSCTLTFVENTIKPIDSKYISKTMFYISSSKTNDVLNDVYIYKNYDIVNKYSNKVTKTEFMEAYETTGVILVTPTYQNLNGLSIIQSYTYPSAVIEGMVGGITLLMVGVENSNGTSDLYYTSEYTPAE
jgi:hypothetical protein